MSLRSLETPGGSLPKGGTAPRLGDHTVFETAGDEQEAGWANEYESADFKDFEMQQEAALRRELEEQQRTYERADTGISHSYGQSYFANFPTSVRGGSAYRQEQVDDDT